MEYMESKSRQNNVCIYNVAENNKGSGITALFKHLIREVLGVSGELNIIRAQHTKNEHQDPRPIAATFLNNATKTHLTSSMGQDRSNT